MERVGDISNSRFTPEERSRLLQNENVLKVDQYISFAPWFKIKAVQSYLLEKKTPSQIFFDAGFDLDLIGRRNPKHYLLHWRRIYEEHGEAGFTERRGRPPRSSGQELTTEEELQRTKRRVKYLEKQVELLKKLEVIERGEADRPATKFELIRELTQSDGPAVPVKELCEIAEVSRSGYYRWLAAEPARLQRELDDYANYLLIKEIFLGKRRRAGYRVMKMNAERQHGITMNHKKIRRIMKKYGLVTIIRGKNYRKQVAKATQEHKVAPYVLNREFSQTTPLKVFCTDITYLSDASGQWTYLSALLDVATGEVVAHHWSTSLALPLSLTMLDEAVRHLGEDTLRGSMINSDQGFHYTHPDYAKKLVQLGIVQSMSRKGNCIDNAPIESFFGHMKDELDLSHCHTSEEVQATVEQYIDYHNHHRYQWARNRMAPAEYRDYLMAA